MGELINQDIYLGLSESAAKELRNLELIPIMEQSLLELLRNQSELRKLKERLMEQENGTKLNY